MRRAYWDEPDYMKHEIFSKGAVVRCVKPFSPRGLCVGDIGAIEGCCVDYQVCFVRTDGKRFRLEADHFKEVSVTIIVKARVRPGVCRDSRFVTFTGPKGEAITATLQARLCDDDAQTVSVCNVGTLGMPTGCVLIQTWNASGFGVQRIVLPVSDVVDWGSYART